MYSSMKFACDYMWRQGQTWGGSGGRVKDAESKDRLEAWSGLVRSAFSKDRSNCGCRKEDVSRCGVDVAAL